MVPHRDDGFANSSSPWSFLFVGLFFPFSNRCILAYLTAGTIGTEMCHQLPLFISGRDKGTYVQVHQAANILIIIRFLILLYHEKTKPGSKHASILKPEVSLPLEDCVKPTFSKTTILIHPGCFELRVRSRKMLC